MDTSFYRRIEKRLNVVSRLKKLLRRRKALAGVLLGGVLAGFLLFSNHGVVSRIQLSQQKAELERKIREAEGETRALQAQSKALDGDKKAIEKVARERYGMARSGEKVYKVHRDEK